MFQATTTRGPDASVMTSSVPHRVNAERLVLLGWGRAILLQLAHPLVAAGVYDHSSFRATPWAAAARLHATVRAMLALTFGTDDEREQAFEGIRAIHRRVHGRLPAAVGLFPAGTPYSAEDPALVLWVHVTLLESVPLVYDLFVAPLTEADRDLYCAGAASVAEALGARAADVPRTWADARAEIARQYASGAIAIGPQARELAGAVLAPRIGRVVPPAAWLNRLVTIGLLPPHVRDQYGFVWPARRQRAFERSVSAVRAVRRAAPGRLALWPEARP
jgi:uncharacterized protein (DUF2236 family)